MSRVQLPWDVTVVLLLLVLNDPRECVSLSAWLTQQYFQKLDLVAGLKRAVEGQDQLLLNTVVDAGTETKSEPKPRLHIKHKDT